MENRRRCEMDKTYVHPAFSSKHLRIKKHLEKEKKYFTRMVI